MHPIVRTDPPRILSPPWDLPPTPRGAFSGWVGMRAMGRSPCELGRSGPTLGSVRGDLGRLARIAASQHGVFTAVQACEVGLTDQGLGALVRSGWCERSSRGVYRVRAAVRTRHQWMTVAVLRAGPDAVLSHRAAAWLWDLPGFGRAKAEVTRPRGGSQRTDAAIVHGSLWLPEPHRTTRDAIATTTAARTAFDLAAVIPPARLAVVVDHLTSHRTCTIDQIRGVFFVLARRGRPGSAAMRALLEELTEEREVPASELERRFRRLVRAARRPQPRVEVNLGGGDWIGRVDALWDDVRLVVELDSRRHHGGLVARDADRRRDNALMAQGWRVLRFTWDDLRDRPNEVVAALRAALDAP